MSSIRQLKHIAYKNTSIITTLFSHPTAGCCQLVNLKGNSGAELHIFWSTLKVHRPTIKVLNFPAPE